MTSPSALRTVTSDKSPENQRRQDGGEARSRRHQDGLWPRRNNSRAAVRVTGRGSRERNKGRWMDPLRRGGFCYFKDGFAGDDALPAFAARSPRFPGTVAQANACFISREKVSASVGASECMPERSRSMNPMLPRSWQAELITFTASSAAECAPWEAPSSLGVGESGNRGERRSR